MIICPLITLTEVYHMKKLSNYTFSAEAKRTIHIIIYIIFLFYSIYLIAQAPSVAVKIAYIAITIIFLTIAVFAEYLEYLSEKAIKALNYECNPEKAKEIYDKLQKFDFFKSYKNNRILFDTIYNLAIYEPNTAIKLIQDNDKYFRLNIDALLIRNVSLFIAYVESNNKTQAKKAYPEIIKLKGGKVKGKKLSPLYNWDELEALHYYISNDFDKACKAYKNVNPLYMNNKEKTQYYLFYYKSLLQNKETEEANQIKQELDKVCNLLPVNKLC